MLSIGKLVSGAEDYYLRTVAEGREEYYTGSGEAPGEWVGRGAAELGLHGVVPAADLRSVLAGAAPDGRVLAAKRGDAARRVSGFDLTFSAPKSVSLLYGLGDEATSGAVRRVHVDAILDALGYLEEHGLRVRRGAGGERRLEAGGFVAAAFVHRTSRAGDPQLHTHLLVANVACGADGRWSALDARRLYFHARTAGFLYQASLRSGLTDALGVRFGPVVNGTAELDDIPKELLEAFSTRRAEIVRHLDEVGATSAKAAEIAALVTRAPKDLSPSRGLPDDAGDGSRQGLRDRWRARAEELDVSDPTLSCLLGYHRREVATGSEIADLVTTLVGPEGLTAKESTFERRDIVRAVAAALPDGENVAEVTAIAEKILSHEEVLALSTVGRGGELRHTTTELLSTERQILEGADRRRYDGVATVAPSHLDGALAERPFLSDEQRALVRRLVTSGAGVEVVVGKAGAGKTAALAAAHDAWAASGHRVLGTALAARAAKGLEDDAGISSTTVARFLAGLDAGSPKLEAGHVLVVDEAGMVGTRTLGRLLDTGSVAGAKVVLVGDPRQLPEIEAGGTFGALGRRLGAIELTENRRQEQAWERAALDELRHGEPGRGLAAFCGADRVRIASDMAGARNDLVAGWLQATRAGEDAVMLAVNHRDVAALNGDARRALRRAGDLGEDIFRVGALHLAAGDVVVCLRNDTSLGVVNGTRGVVEGAGERAVTIATGGVRRVLPVTYLEAGHLAHGYAVTVHKAQGATVDRAFVLATDSLTREAGYVAMSRARKRTELFVPGSAFEDGVALAHVTTSTTPSVDPLQRVAQRLEVSRAKHQSIDELEGLAVPGPAPLANGGGELHRRDAREVPDRPDPAVEGRHSHSPVGDRPQKQPALRVRYLEPVMGSRPWFLDERVEYDRVARLVTTYRRRFGVEGDDALGPLPLEATRRAAYEAIRSELRVYQRRLGRSLELDSLDLGRGR